nr:hypothetical protein [Deltaproteobacteria bacterium]
MTVAAPSSIIGAPSGFAVVRRSGVIDAVGEGSILGRPAHELAGQSVCDVWAETPAAIAAAHGALAGQEMVVEVEASGARWALRATPERDDAGTVRGAMLVAHDHTSKLDRDRLPPGLLESLYEHVPDVIFLKRADTLRFVLF